jgi:hypothetical protein
MIFFHSQSSMRRGLRVSVACEQKGHSALHASVVSIWMKLGLTAGFMAVPRDSGGLSLYYR